MASDASLRTWVSDSLYEGSSRLRRRIQPGPEKFVNWTEWTIWRSLVPVPRTRVIELAADPIRQVNWTERTFLNDFELNLSHSDTTPHPGQASKHSVQRVGYLCFVLGLGPSTWILMQCLWYPNVKYFIFLLGGDSYLLGTFLLNLTWTLRGIPNSTPNGAPSGVSPNWMPNWTKLSELETDHFKVGAPLNEQKKLIRRAGD